MRKKYLHTTLFAFFGLIAFYTAMNTWMNNFHVVIPNELYRSGQLDAGDIAHYTNRYGLRSIINLRGDNSGNAWYDQEIQESKNAGIQHIDFRMSAKRILPREEALRLIDIMYKAPKPLLIHCNGGANRTSLAAALYFAAIKHADERTAESQLSILYGNFPTWLGSKSRMSETFEQLEDVLGYEGS